MMMFMPLISYAQTLEFHFAIVSESPHIAGDITGRILGLQDNAANQAASAIIIESFPTPLGGVLDNGNNPVLWDSPLANSFDVAAGEIVAGVFAAQDLSGVLDTLVINLGFQIAGAPNNGLSLDNGATFAGNANGFAGTRFVRAQPFQFFIPSEPPFIAGLITGRILGLQDNTMGQSAMAVLIDRFPDALNGVLDAGRDAAQWGSILANSFDVTAGEIVAGVFAAQDLSGVLDTLVINLGFQIAGAPNNGLSLDNGATFSGNNDGAPGTLYTVAEPTPAQFLHTVSGDGQTYVANFQRHANRSPNFQVQLQQSDGTLTPHVPTSSATYIGSVLGVPGASANALIRADDAIYYHVLFEDGTEWRNEGGDTVISSSPLTATSWPQLVPAIGGAGSDIFAAEVGVDLPFERLNSIHNGDVDAALEMIEHSITSANMLYLRDTGIEHHLGRVLIRGSQAQDPYAGLTTHNEYLATVTQQWDNVLPPSTHDLALVVRATSAAGLAPIGRIGNPPGYASTDATPQGDFYGPWRHEAAHNWSVGHFDGGAPEGSTINSGNALSGFSGPEQMLVTTFRDRQAAFLDNLGPFDIALPPQAATDHLYLSSLSDSAIIDVLANDHDANGDALTLLSVDADSELMLGGTMSLAPGAGANGRDAVRYVAPTLNGPTSAIDRFKYRIRDASGREAIGYVFVRLVQFGTQYAQDFNGFSNGFADFNDGSFISNITEGTVASVQDGALQLTPDELFRLAAYTLPLTNLENGYVASFRFRIEAQNTPADILALNFGDPIPSLNNQTASRFAKGLTLEIVTFPSQLYRIQVHGTEVPQGSLPASELTDGQSHEVSVEWRPQASPADGKMTVTVDGTVVFNGIETPGFTPTTSDMLAFSARTGGFSQRVLIDDVTAGQAPELPPAN